MQRFLALGILILLSGIVLAEDARQLRLEAGVLIQAAETADSARERRALLEEAHAKLLEIRERWPSASARLHLYLGGRRVSLSPEDVAAMTATARLADLDIGNLHDVLGRALSPTAVDENGWTDLHYAAALNLPELIEALLDAGANIAAQVKADREPLSERLRQSLRDLDIFSEFTRQGYMPLHVAAFNNAREAAAGLIARGADMHAKAAGNGVTPLHAAAYGNASDVAVDLIARGADIYVKDNPGLTPLHAAAYGNASDVAVELIARGADIHVKNNRGSTPLHAAAYRNASDVAADLIARGADIHVKDNRGLTPLHAAAYGNASDVAVELIAHGADIHAKNNHGMTLLHAAAHGNAWDVAADLIARGADIHAKDNDGKTPLQLAEQRGHREVLKLLRERQEALLARLSSLDAGTLREVLERELSPTAADENGWTDLHYAAALNLPELVEALLDAGADIAPETNSDREPLSEGLTQSLRDLNLFSEFTRKGYTPLHIAALNNAREAAMLLSARGADIHAKATESRTPLHVAALGNAPEAAAELIALGADIHAKDWSGLTPLHVAALENAPEAAAELIALGADIHAKGRSGLTPLHVAALGNAPEAAAELIALGADIHAKDNDGWTPLHMAAMMNAREAVAELIAFGADIHTKNNDGWTPLDVSVFQETSEIEALLRRHGASCNRECP